MLPVHLRQQVEISSASIRVCTAKAAHSDDEAKILFGTLDVLTRDWTNTGWMISDRLQSYRVAYAYNGSLNAPSLPVTSACDSQQTVTPCSGGAGRSTHNSSPVDPPAVYR
jgi:hypothetical protein